MMLTTKSASITKTMKQLIFRINIQQYRNKKYKHKDQHQLDSSKDQHQSDSKTPVVIDLVDDDASTEYVYLKGRFGNLTNTHL